MANQSNGMTDAEWEAFAEKAQHVLHQDHLILPFRQPDPKYGNYGLTGANVRNRHDPNKTDPAMTQAIQDLLSTLGYYTVETEDVVDEGHTIHFERNPRPSTL
jgi:hypothetical protein